MTQSSCILLIARDPSTRSALRNYLQNLSFEVVEAEGFSSGSIVLRSRRVDVILTDAVLSDGNAQDFVKLSGCLEQGPQVVVLTDGSDLSPMMDAVRSGAVDHLERPVSMERLLVVIGRALGRSHAIRERQKKSDAGRVALVLDDDPATLRSATNVLASLGFVAFQAASCAEARQILSKHEIDVAVFDVILPDGTGLELLSELKTANPGVPALVMARAADAVTPNEALQAGACDFLNKPMSAEALAASLLRACQSGASPVEPSRIEALHEENRARLAHLSSQLEGKVAEKSALIEKLQESMLSIMDSLPVGILVVDLNGVITDINLSGSGILGHDPSDLYGRPVNEVPVLNEVCGPLMKAARCGQRVNLLECEIRRKEGESILLGFGVAPLKSRRDGDPTGALAHFSDITLRKRTEQYVARSDKLVSLGMLAAGLAHDINNPLAISLGFIDLLDLDARVSGDMRMCLEKVRGNILRCRDIVSGMLSLSRSETGLRTMVDLGEVAANIGGLLERQLRLAGVDLSIRCQQEVRVLASKVEMEQLLFNLLINARDACTEKSGGQVEVSLESDGREVRLTVRDTGVGMSAVQKERLFTPFFTTKGEGKGTGLGLSICHGIVERHGGRISVNSQHGMGTVFEMSFPVPVQVVDADAKTAIRTGSREQTTRRLSVLVVDDEPDIVRFCKIWLERAGHTMASRPPGPEALSEALTGPYDVLLLDLRMPGIDGLQMLRAVRKTRPSCPVIIMTGSLGAFNSGFLIDEGAATVLRKPFESSELKEALLKLAQPSPGS